MTEFEAFVTAHYPRLVRASWLMTGDAARAEDFVQDALLGAYRHWARLDTDPLSYVYRSIANARTSWWRRTRHERPLDPVESGHDTTGGATERHDLLEALRALPPGQRHVVVLRFLEDLSVDETAAVLGIAPGTVKSQTSKALASLRVSPALLEEIR